MIRAPGVLGSIPEIVEEQLFENLKSILLTILTS